MKRKLRGIIPTVLCLAILYVTGTGFLVQTSAYIRDDFFVSEDGSEITFRVGVASSMGYVRGYKDAGGGVKPHYLKFYSAWGGWNSSWGAREEYTLHLGAEDTEIYVYRGDGGYTLALQKDIPSGEWHSVGS